MLYILWPFGIFGGDMVYFMTIWYILYSFGTFFRVWYLAPRKIWQPCGKSVTHHPPLVLPAVSVAAAEALALSGAREAVRVHRRQDPEVGGVQDLGATVMITTYFRQFFVKKLPTKQKGQLFWRTYYRDPCSLASKLCFAYAK
jgi:hypothetical protein